LSIGLKIVGHGEGAVVKRLLFFMIASVVHGAKTPLTTDRFILFAGVLACVAGVFAGCRETRDWFVLLQYGSNTGIMGAGLALVATFWVDEIFLYQMMALGMITMLGLGGLVTVDFVNNLTRKWVSNKVKEQK
jgi:hypothetical protein